MQNAGPKKRKKKSSIKKGYIYIDGPTGSITFPNDKLRKKAEKAIRNGIFYFWDIWGRNYYVQPYYAEMFKWRTAYGADESIPWIVYEHGRDKNWKYWKAPDGTLILADIFEEVENNE